MSLDPELASQFAAVGVQVPTVLLPGPQVDLARWAVVACDQHTSEPEYWQQVEQVVGQAPSSLRVVFPEVYLDQPDATSRIDAIHQSMQEYLDRELFVEHPDTMMLVRRIDSVGATRWGLIVALDLDHYDWHAGSRSLMRATEGTIEDRLPPRVAVRRDAPLELPHIMVLVSDADRALIEPLTAQIDTFEQCYHTTLMLGGGQVTGWAVPASTLPAVADRLTAMRAALDPDNPLLFAMGDGNHSFATAKSYWEALSPTLTPAEREQHPARFALVEISNIYDPGLEFEPIHRALFNTSQAEFDAELARHCARFEATEVGTIETGLAAIAGDSSAELGQRSTEAEERAQRFVLVQPQGVYLYSVYQPRASITAGTVQRVIDALLDSRSDQTERAIGVDYIHGDQVAAALGQQPGNLAVLLPPVAKDTFFASIVADSALPRKTFSLGNAADKRYYLEARAIR